jgi:nucleoside-diphosphate-sugar epimerase
MAEFENVAAVTGGTGMVGSHLIERLIKEGFAVRALVRNTSDTSFLEQLGNVELFVGDITDAPQELEPFCRGARYIFHCAALVDDWADRDEMYKANVTGLENMIHASQKAPPEKFVFLGSMAVLGMGKQEDLDESAPYVHTGDNYNYTKIEAEKLSMKYGREKGFPIAVLRPPYIYGERDRQFLPRVVASIENRTFTLVGGGTNPISIVYIGNVIEALMLVAKSEKSAGNIYMITDDKPISRKELVKIIAEGMGLPVPTRTAPVWFARMMCFIFETMAKITRKKEPPLLNRFRLKFLYPHMTFDISKIKNELGYTHPFTLEEGLEQSIEWYRKEKKKDAS